MINNNEYNIFKNEIIDKKMKRKLKYYNRTDSIYLSEESNNFSYLERNIKKYNNNKIIKWYSKTLPTSLVILEYNLFLK